MQHQAFDPRSGSLLDGLNDAQREAVRHPGGPLLVLAGAGSGKTRVITHRIAWLIREGGVSPSRIVAVTFTNKAAAQMRERVDALLGAETHPAWVGTFHALCLRVLRRDGERVGLPSGFAIYDTDDQLAVVKRILKEEAPDDDSGTPRSFLSRISRAKNALMGPAELERHAFTPDKRLAARIYARYEEVLARSAAVDFDDLLLRTIQLLREHEEVRDRYASGCEQLLVDEYQDTNRPQYLLVRALSSTHGNVCVVGDEDQCIYRFRGAELRNILEFESDHPGTRTIRLEQNYRSTSTILDAAGSVIANNVQRKGKQLWTENPRGEKIRLYRAPDDRTEAAWVAARLRELSRETPFDKMAVLYRTNAQSRLFEEILRAERLPYQIVGSVQFYERREVKDILAYLRLTLNPDDDVSFRRVLNVPPRGVGDTTLEAIESFAGPRGLSLWRAAAAAVDSGTLATRPARMLREFLAQIESFRARLDDATPPELIERIVAALQYEAYLDKLYGGLGSERMENVQSLISAAVEYVEAAEEASLRGFLDRSALVADADEVGREPGVTLMTIHCAKGLEFPVVFLVGLEERLFPHAMAASNEDDVEEERRLCYVAMTRARERLLLSHAALRRFQGALLPSLPSRFLREIPPATLEEDRQSAGSGFFDTWAARERDEGWSGGSSAARAVRDRPVAPGPPPPRPVAARAAEEDAADGYRVGLSVRHPRFGDGRITDREGTGRNLKLTIHFRDHGAKKILAAYTRLAVEVPPR